MPDYLKRAKELISKNDFLMVSKTWCGDCQYTYRIWDKYHVKSKVHIIELDKFEDQAEASKLESAITELAGRKWVPTIYLKGQRFDEQDLKRWEAEGITENEFKKVGLL
ncbi:hypothetical protein PSN45_003299 [Yamadazyma tenuis]|uniref:Glutaredoxin domain-containing protein n=1 Tax=Candida tenuis (strain ATCC 10573 / BCRC 21748 / CBS 615 / JCM 9827 / NBRC 10315 / NRRL Y-1498 / VKM Y-70) TaxID=590646 RepID=G3AYP3_CANTC|nr:uncharacterized protein CANTEDRAFT_101513 [Yamadazyma tenuis ATCC 10573]EGV65899.1 hypothetical protein CANTEDRAFT_101513 [Yamadazyma tenuis ATCC 10573]WEJ95772.1 hypothetical protein PSN45_003299 [Yamadazyma tenuis]